jgi:hypothetical protein
MGEAKAAELNGYPGQDRRRQQRHAMAGGAVDLHEIAEARVEPCGQGARPEDTGQVSSTEVVENTVDKLPLHRQSPAVPKTFVKFFVTAQILGRPKLLILRVFLLKRLIPCKCMTNNAVSDRYLYHHQCCA